ncbi:MAG: Fe-S cluster assembly protein HesB [Nocardioides sp.]
MLTMTPKALSVVRSVTAHPRLGANSGLRIASRRATSQPLQVGAVSGPRPGDRVVERDGARIFLGPVAARQIAGRRLDVMKEPNGRIHFVVKNAR